MKHICAAPSDMLQTCAGFTCLSFLQYRMSSCQWTSGFPKVVCWPSWHHSHCMSSAIRLERQESLNTSDLFSPFQFTLCSQMCTRFFWLFYDHKYILSSWFVYLRLVHWNFMLIQHLFQFYFQQYTILVKSKKIIFKDEFKRRQSWSIFPRSWEFLLHTVQECAVCSSSSSVPLWKRQSASVQCIKCI